MVLHLIESKKICLKKTHPPKISSNLRALLIIYFR